MTLGLALVAAGCDTATGPASTTVYSGALAVMAPAGYCIDSTASRTTAGFVTAASCARLGRSGNLPTEDGLITYQVGEAGTAFVTGSESQLSRYLRTAEGKALLSQTGDGAAIKVGSTDPSRGVVTVYFSDESPAPVPGLGQHEWRAFLDLGDRLVTIAIRGFVARPMTRAEGDNLLVAAIVALRAGNGL